MTEKLPGFHDSEIKGIVKEGEDILIIISGKDSLLIKSVSLFRVEDFIDTNIINCVWINNNKSSKSDILLTIKEAMMMSDGTPLLSDLGINLELKEILSGNKISIHIEPSRGATIYAIARSIMADDNGIV